MCFHMTQSGVAVVTSKQTNICWEAMLGMKQSKGFVLAFGCIEKSIAGQHRYVAGCRRPRTCASMTANVSATIVYKFCNNKLLNSCVEDPLTAGMYICLGSAVIVVIKYTCCTCIRSEFAAVRCPCLSINMHSWCWGDKNSKF